MSCGYDDMLWMSNGICEKIRIMLCAEMLSLGAECRVGGNVSWGNDGF
jgi:hypothetical protein